MTAQNTLTLTAELINRDLRPLILEKTTPYVSDYRVDFSDGLIFLEATLTVQTLGAVHARYQLKVTDLTFRPGRRTLTADYQEDIRPAGGPMQAMLLKAISATSGSLLEKAIGMAKRPGITATAQTVTVDLDQFGDIDDTPLRSLTLTYLDSRDDTLKLAFGLA